MQGGYGASPIELMATQAMLDGDIYCTGFTYSATYLVGTGTALGANGVADSPIQINADSDFVVQELNIAAWTGADAPETNPDYLLLINIAGSGRNIMNQAQAVMTYCGAFAATNGVQEFNRLPMPMLWPANTTIANTLTNRSATAANRVDLAFRGFKVYYLGDSNQLRKNIFHVL